MNHTDQIANAFTEAHRIEIRSKSVFPNMNASWTIDGQEMTTKRVKGLLIPAVRERIGIEPKALNRIIWKILAKNVRA